MDSIGELYYRRDCNKKQRIPDWQWAEQSSELNRSTNSQGDTSMQHLNNSVDRNPYRQAPSGSPSIDRNPREQVDPERLFKNYRIPYRHVHPGGSPSIDRNPCEEVDSTRSFKNDRYLYRQVHPGRSPSIERSPHKQVDPERSFNNDRNPIRQLHPGRSSSIDRNLYRQVHPGRSPSIDRNPYRQVHPGRSPSIDRNPREQVDPGSSFNNNRNSNRQVHPGRSPRMHRNPREQVYPERSFKNNRYYYRRVHRRRSPSIDRNPCEQVDPERSFNNDMNSYGQVHPGRSPSIDRNPREQVDPERSFNNDRNSYRRVHPGRSPSIDRNPREQVDPEKSFKNDRNSYRQVHPGRAPSIDRNPREQVDPERSFRNDRNSYRKVHPGRSPSIDSNPLEQVAPEKSFNNDWNTYRQVHPGRSPSIDRNPREQVDPERSFKNDRNSYRQVHPGRSPSIDSNPREQVDPEKSFNNDWNPYRQVHPGRSPSIDRNPREQVDPERSFNNDRNSFRQVHPGRSTSIDRNPREQLDPERSFNNDRNPYREVHPGGRSTSIDRNPREQLDPERSFNNDKYPYREVHPGRSPSIDSNPREQLDPERSFNNDKYPYRQVHPGRSPSIDSNPREQIDPEKSFNNDWNPYRQVYPGRSPSIDRNPREQVDPERSFNNDRNPYRQMYPGRSPSIDRNLCEQVNPERSFNNDRNPYRQVHPVRSPCIDRNPCEQFDPEKSFNNDRSSYRQVHLGRSPSIDLNPREQVDPERSFNNDRNPYRQIYPSRSPSLDRNPREQIDPERSLDNDRYPYREVHPGRSPSFDRNPREQVDPERSLNNDRNPSRQVDPGGCLNFDRNPDEQVHPDRSDNTGRNPSGQLRARVSVNIDPRERMDLGRSLKIDKNSREQVHSDKYLNIDGCPNRQVHPSGCQSIDRNPSIQELPKQSPSIDRNSYRQAFPDRSFSFDRNPSVQVRPGGYLKETLGDDLSKINSREDNKLQADFICEDGETNLFDPVAKFKWKRMEAKRKSENEKLTARYQVNLNETSVGNRVVKDQVAKRQRTHAEQTQQPVPNCLEVHQVTQYDRFRTPALSPSNQMISARMATMESKGLVNSTAIMVDKIGPEHQIQQPPPKYPEKRQDIQKVRLQSPLAVKNIIQRDDNVDAESVEHVKNYMNKTICGQVHPSGLNTETLKYELSKINVRGDNNLQGDFLPEGTEINPHDDVSSEKPITKSKRRRVKRAQWKKENEKLATANQFKMNAISARTATIKSKEELDSITPIDMIQKMSLVEKANPNKPSSVQTAIIELKEVLDSTIIGKIQKMNPEKTNHKVPSSVKSATIASKGAIESAIAGTSTNQMQKPPPKFSVTQETTQDVRRQSLAAAKSGLSIMVRRDDGVAVDDVTVADISKKLTAKVFAAVLEGVCGLSMAFTAAGLVEEGYFLLRPSTEEAVKWLLGCDFGISNGVTLSAKKLDAHRATIWLPNNTGYHPFHSMKFIIAHNNHIKDLKLPEWTLIRKDTLPHGERYLMSVPQEVPTGDVWLHYQAMQIHIRIFDSGVQQPKIKCECKAVCQIHAPINTLTDEQIAGPNHCEAADIDEGVDSNVPIALEQETVSEQTQHPSPKCEREQATQYEGLRRPVISPSEYSVMIQREDGVALDKAAAAKINERLAGQILESLQDSKRCGNLSFTASGFVGAGFFLVRPSSEEAMTWLLGCDFGDWRGVPLTAKKLFGHVTTIWLPHSTGYLPLDPLKYIKTQNTREDLKLPEWTLMRKTTLPLGERLFVSVPVDLEIRDAWLDYQATQLHVRIFSYEHTQPEPDCTCVAVCPLHATRNLLGDQIYDDGNEQRRPAQLANLLPVKPPGTVKTRKQILKIYRKKVMKKMVILARKARDRAKGKYKVRKYLTKEVKALKAKKLKEKKRLSLLKRQKVWQQRAKLRAAMKLKAEMEKRGIQ